MKALIHKTSFIKNSVDKLDFIGKESKVAGISIEGDAGAYLGFGMKIG